MPSVAIAQAQSPCVLALDLGTSSFRALVFDTQVRAVTGTACQLEYDLVTSDDGGAEVDAGLLLDLATRCIDGALARAGRLADRISGVGSTSFWHSLVGLDADGEPTTPVLIWADSRSRAQVDELRDELDAEWVHQETGAFLHSSYWPAKLRWIRAERPDWWARTRHWCSFTDLLFRRLCGDGRTSVSMASGTGLLAVHESVWHERMAAHSGIDAGMLPELTERDQPLAPLRPEWAARWPALADVPWFPAIGDGAAANVGCFAARTGRLALTVGTSGAMRMVARVSRVTVPAGLWAYRLDAERYVLGGALSNGGNATAWLRDLLGTSFDSADYEAAVSMPPDSHGLTILPFLAGERSPNWNDHAEGTVAGLRLSTTRAQVLRALLEAVIYRFALIDARLRPLVGEDPMVIANGGALLRSTAWLQMAADVLDEPVVALPPEDEASAAGAAIMALVGIGALDDVDSAPDWATEGDTHRYDPDPASHRIYRRAVERQSRLERRLFPEGTSWDPAG